MPPYSQRMALDCLLNYAGDCFIYVGAGEGGCCGNDDFFALLDEGWELITDYSHPQWFGIHDVTQVYQRKTPALAIKG